MDRNVVEMSDGMIRNRQIKSDIEIDGRNKIRGADLSVFTATVLKKI